MSNQDLIAIDLLLSICLASSTFVVVRPHANGFDHQFHSMPPEFPEVQGGGSLLLAWQIRNKRVLVVGGGEVSDLITLIP
jgi:hypothetical protein